MNFFCTVLWYLSCCFTGHVYGPISVHCTFKNCMRYHSSENVEFVSDKTIEQGGGWSSVSVFGNSFLNIILRFWLKYLWMLLKINFWKFRKGDRCFISEMDNMRLVFCGARKHSRNIFKFKISPTNHSFSWTEICENDLGKFTILLFFSVYYYCFILLICWLIMQLTPRIKWIVMSITEDDHFWKVRSCNKNGPGPK